MISVVIVDDQSTSLKLLSQVVKSIDFHNAVVSVKTFLETTQALKWVKHHTPDLVMIDYNRQQRGAQFDPICVDAVINYFDKIKDVNKQYGQTDLQLCQPNNL